MSPSAAELAQWGMTLADFESEPVTYWLDTAGAVNLFCRLGTQWRVGGMGELVGLDYAAVYPLLDRLQLEPVAWEALLDDVQMLEAEALETRAEAREKEQQNPARQ